jgi:hypothetical protein
VVCPRLEKYSGLKEVATEGTAGRQSPGGQVNLVRAAYTISTVSMPELWVVHEFHRCCIHAIGTDASPCTIYFNPKDFRSGKSKVQTCEVLVVVEN